MARTKITLTPKTKATTKQTHDAGSKDVEIDAILLREEEDTRKLNAAHVVMLAESISILGLLEPIVIDTKGHLLAGGHRLAAMQILTIADATVRRQEFLERTGYVPDPDNAPTKELEGLADRVAQSLHVDAFIELYPDYKVPVVVMEASGKDSKHLSLAIEAAENNVRRQYHPDEIRALAKRYEDAGYDPSKGGRPKKGEITLLTKLEASLGRSKRQIQRWINPTKSKRGKSEWAKAVAALGRAVNKIMETGAKREDEQEKSLVASAERIAKVIEKLGEK